jgi:hypothetical protein
MQNIWFLLIFLSFSASLNAQLINPDTIQISGVVLAADSLISLPNVHIMSHKNKGTLTDSEGQFAFKINVGDTLTFSYLGYKPYRFIVPDTLTMRQYVAGIVLRRDTVMLTEVIILPFMNRQQFRHMFINNKPDLQTINATRNLNIAEYQSRQFTPWYTPDIMIDMQLKKYASDVEYRGMIGPDEQLNIIGLTQLLIFYSHQQLTKAEKNRRIKEELRRYLEQKYPE